MSEHQSCYFYANSKDKKQRADPDIFGCEKHQQTAQNKQGDGQESFCTRVSDHGCKEIPSIKQSNYRL